MTNGERLGNKLYELRKKNHLSQEELAEKLGVSRQAVSKWECGESLPDTDNLITISRLYGVSLDELVGNPTTERPHEAESKQENSGQASSEDNAQSARKKGIHIDENDIHIDVEGKIHFDEDGVHVGGENGIHINDDGVHVGEELNINVHVDVPIKKQSNKQIALRVLTYLPYPIVITIAYLLWGFLGDGWTLGWTLYVTIPVYYSVIECIQKKKASHFAYPVFVTFIYLFVGMQWGYWHPNWILFVTIPIYYAITAAIEKR